MSRLYSSMKIFFRNKKSPAFQRELYELHFRRIYNTCLRIIGNPQDAEETMHDVFLKLFDKIEDLHDEKAFYSWSQRVTIRTAIDRVRAKSKLVFEQIENKQIENLPDADDEPEEEMELSVEDVKRELNNLPDGYRIVLSMRLFEECEFEEIAKVLQIKVSTVRSQYVRGRDKLAEKLKQLKIKN